MDEDELLVDWLLLNKRITQKDLDDFVQAQMSTFPAMVSSTSTTSEYYATPNDWYRRLTRVLVSFNKILAPMPEIHTQQGRGTLTYESVPGKTGGNAPRSGKIAFTWYKMVSGNWEMVCYCC